MYITIDKTVYKVNTLNLLYIGLHWRLDYITVTDIRFRIIIPTRLHPEIYFLDTADIANIKIHIFTISFLILNDFHFNKCGEYMWIALYKQIEAAFSFTNFTQVLGRLYKPKKLGSYSSFNTVFFSHSVETLIMTE